MKTLHYLFSRNDKIGSKAISWGSSLFKEDIKYLDQNKIPSHVAVLIDEQFVIESTLTTGVRVIPYSRWLEINEELYKIKCIQDISQLEAANYELLTEVWGKGYDWFGIAYYAQRMARYFLFKTHLPAKNRWERENYFFCTEFAARLSGYNYSMTTPAKMCSDYIYLTKCQSENQ